MLLLAILAATEAGSVDAVDETSEDSDEALVDVLDGNATSTIPGRDGDVGLGTGVTGIGTDPSTLVASTGIGGVATGAAMEDESAWVVVSVTVIVVTDVVEETSFIPVCGMNFRLVPVALASNWSLSSSARLSLSATGKLPPPVWRLDSCTGSRRPEAASYENNWL